MRIVIDMQGAQGESRFRGIGRYTLAFAKAVARNRGGHEVMLALSGLFPSTVEPLRAEFEGLLPQENIRVWKAPGPVRGGNDARRDQAELVREAFLASLRPDIIHISSLFEGLLDDAVVSIGRFDGITPVSVTLYDLIPLLNPAQYLEPHPAYEQYYRRKIQHLERAVLCLAISDFCREESIRALPNLEGKCVSVSTAIDDIFRRVRLSESEADRIRRQFDIVRPFILSTGGADERKNLPRLIQAYAALPARLREGHQLLFAGKMSDSAIAKLKQVARSARLKDDALLFTGYVSDDELLRLYNLCRLYVFPSWHEGFGLPALEAMACGAPVIGANASSLPEVIGLSEALFDPFDVEAIAHKMTQALEDEDFRSRLCVHGAEQAGKFSWDETAGRAIAEWERHARGLPKRPATDLAATRPRLAFVSPLPPERTGIADYSAELLPALAEHYDIELVVAQDCVEPPLAKAYGGARDANWLRANADQVDRVLYQMGNSHFHAHMLDLLQDVPGVVVLHDFYLSGLMEWMEVVFGRPHAWAEALLLSHGYGAVRDRYLDGERARKDYPANWHVLQHAQGVIVHSAYSRELAKGWYREHACADWRIIPLVRKPPDEVDREAARKRLGLDVDDFVLCSFGFLTPYKNNHRLLRAWSGSSLAADPRCRLIFVGENNAGDYGAMLNDMIKVSGCEQRIDITGFAEADDFRQYLAAADLAVQLRTNSRGETSGAVLDCMGNGVPVIANANGAMAEFDSESVWLIPDDFDDEQLVEALEALRRDAARRAAMGARGREIIRERHAPTTCANAYRDAIEGFHRAAVNGLPALIRSLAPKLQGPPVDDGGLRLLSRTLAQDFPLPRPARRIYLDITATCVKDLRTGIERVARALTLSLLESPPDGYRIVEPVYLSEDGGRWHYRHARRYVLGLLGCPPDILQDDIAEPGNGDVLIGLDISGGCLVQAAQYGLLQRWRAQGCKVHFILYDILPLRMPQVFPPGADEACRCWLESVLQGDGVVCISKSVAGDLRSWIDENEVSFRNRRSFGIEWFHLGADLSASDASSGMPDDARRTLEAIRQRPSFLMVGTIEPRKGHQQVIDAFGQLWAEGLEANLIVVGQEGWKDLPPESRRDIHRTVECLRNHPQLGSKLFWLEGISDEYLENVYAASACLIAASYGEGFGLPLIEAAHHGLPIVARDIPVFREVAGEHAYYFDASSPDELGRSLKTWIDLYQRSDHPESDGLPWLTWRESAAHLLDSCLTGQGEQREALICNTEA